ncbi:MAG: hypothetical protein LBF39_00425 [Prevotellaceae bacterium]|jgi:uncharacterized protein (TIGR02145 family)|nr:hypothetical protein [Prevotellaceae bacterium]
MKTTMSKQLLFLAAFCCMAASVAAQTVDVTLQCGQSYTINSTAPATDASGLTYRWLENGSPVTGAVANYTVPATKHAGTYTYIRQAKTEDCPDWQNSNAFTVAVVNPDDGTCIAGTTWAKYNVDVPGSFTTSSYDLGMYYKWDSLKYIPPTAEVNNWDHNASPNNVWSDATNPCPDGWRLPTRLEWSLLVHASPGWFNNYCLNKNPIWDRSVTPNVVVFGPMPTDLQHPTERNVILPCGPNTMLDSVTPNWNNCGYWASEPYMMTTQNRDMHLCLMAAVTWGVAGVRCVR